MQQITNSINHHAGRVCCRRCHGMWTGQSWSYDSEANTTSWVGRTPMVVCPACAQGAIEWCGEVRITCDWTSHRWDLLLRRLHQIQAAALEGKPLDRLGTIECQDIQATIRTSTCRLSRIVAVALQHDFPGQVTLIS